MKNTVTYEWTTEQLNQDGDIVDTDFDIHLDSLLSYAQGSFSVGLVRYSGNHEEGEQERGYAYVQDGKLEEEFSTGQKVPQRFIDQLSKSI